MISPPGRPDDATAAGRAGWPVIALIGAAAAFPALTSGEPPAVAGLRGPQALASAESAVAMLRDAAGALDHYAYVLTKSEWKSGRQLPVEEILVEVRERPREVRMRWIGRARRGQQLEWSPDRNRGFLLVRPSGLASFMTVRLDPHDERAMRESRHPVSDAGVATLLGIFERTLARLRECGLTPAFLDLGPREVRGQPSRCLSLELPKQTAPELYARRAEICLHQGAALPTSVRVWDVEDGALRLVESYQYSDWHIASPPPVDGDQHPSTTGGS